MMARFQAIPQFTRQAPYHIDVPWRGLERQLAEYIEQGLDLDSTFSAATSGRSSSKTATSSSYCVVV